MGRAINALTVALLRHGVTVVLVSVALLGGSPGYAVSPLKSRVYVTRTGKMQLVRLSDGSVAHLNTRTRLEWQENTEERCVVLHEGEAYFEVTPDAARPFRVLVEGSVIQALGTRFNVYKKARGQVILTVLEGIVQVEGQPLGGQLAWQRQLSANQSLSYDAQGVIAEVSTSSTATRAVSWRERMLLFEDEPLPQVLEELQRYTDKRLVIADGRLNELRMGGMIRSWNIKRALSQLGRIGPIVVREYNDTYELGYRESR